MIAALAMAASIHRFGVPSRAGPNVRTAIRQMILLNRSYPVRRAEVGMRVGGESALEDLEEHHAGHHRRHRAYGSAKDEKEHGRYGDPNTGKYRASLTHQCKRG
jgi:hypothetical protein